MRQLDSRARQGWAVLTALSWLAAGALYLTLPPEPDQFHHAYMGWRWVEGDVPYRDFIDMNWPGTIGLHALSAWIFGVHIWSWRAADFLLFALSAVFLADLVRNAQGADAGRYCLILSPLIYVGMDAWISGQHDMSAAHFLVVALWCHVRAYQGRNWRWQLGAGALLGAAMLCKPTVGVMGALLPLHALTLRLSYRTVVVQTSVLFAAVAATIAAAMAGVVALGTPLSYLVDAIYTYNAATQYLPNETGTGPGSSQTQNAMQALMTRLWSVLWQEKSRWWIATGLLALPAFVRWLLPRNRTAASSALLLLGLTGLLSLLIQSRGFGYHLSPCAPMLIAGLSASIAYARARVRTGEASSERRLWHAYLAIASLWLALRIVVAYYSLPLSLLAGDYRIHLSRFNAGDQLVASDVVDFARKVEQTDRSGCLLSVGTVSAVNYLAKRRQPTRFYYFPVIAKAQPPLPMAEKWIDLWESDLKKANCQYVLIAAPVDRDWLHGPSRAAQALRTLLHQYRQSGVLGATGGMIVYERAAPANEGPDAGQMSRRPAQGR